MTPCDAYVRHLNLFKHLYVLDMYITTGCAIAPCSNISDVCSGLIISLHCTCIVKG